VSGVDLPDPTVARALAIAPRLLGARLTVGEVTVRLTEVEAYEGADDPASHAFRGRTQRNQAMFGPGGHLYVYFSYGMHWAANLVCGPEGVASGVLLRAGEVIAGNEVARARRGGVSDRDLARGPGRLGQALGLNRSFNGAPVHPFSDSVVSRGARRLEGPPVPVHLAPPLTSVEVASGPRVGISRAAERPWRFWIAGDRYVSGFRGHSPRSSRTSTARDDADRR
jgi:DNA-3-methyladenine glycosylase